MTDSIDSGAPLTASQKALVRDNLGLIGVHLRRHVPTDPAPRRDREREDLFQEGCLGLIQAAMRYRPERGIPFASFALPRIHNAVSRALARKFSTVYVPPKRSRRGGRDSDSPSNPTTGRDTPTVRSLSDGVEADLRDRRRHDPGSPDVETIGRRVRHKYEKALRAAGKLLSAKSTTRGDRAELVDLLSAERLSIPHEDMRTPLRQIARRTRSSYARVAQCDRQLVNVIREQLESDPEFLELLRHKRMDERGLDLPIDHELETQLIRASADEFIARFRRASPLAQARALDVALRASGLHKLDLLRTSFEHLPRADREALLRDVAAPYDERGETVSRHRHRARGGCRNEDRVPSARQSLDQCRGRAQDPPADDIRVLRRARSRPA